MNTEVSVGLAHKVCLAAVAQGYTPELLNALAENPDLFTQLLHIQCGYAEIKLFKHVINCDADPFIPSDRKVESHTKGGQFVFDPTKIMFYLSPNQQDSKVMEGNKLRKELANESVLNANVLDYLLTHPELIPEDWKKDGHGNIRHIFFWGTIYRHSNGHLRVRYLYFYVGRWHWDDCWLGNSWVDNCPAALRAN